MQSTSKQGGVEEMTAGRGALPDPGDGVRSRSRELDQERMKTEFVAAGYELIETHISLVFLGESDVFKIKKAVCFGFLDFRDIESRRRFCNLEVELNRRLARGVYLGVVPITKDASGNYDFDGRGATVDWAVRMRRLPDNVRADLLLDAGKISREDVAELAELVARFHDEARDDARTRCYGSVAALEVNVCENFEQTNDTILKHLDEAEADRIRLWQLDFLADNYGLLESRVAEGRIRDGHGDLRLEHVYFAADGLKIIDRIEFSERFRYADVCADLAFLAMDLVYHDRSDLAEHLIACYARTTGDYDLYQLIDFYQSYRAFVRAKIASFAAADVKSSTSSREKAAESARRYFCCAMAFECVPLRIPQVIVVGGMIASGKSTVAKAIGELLGAPVIDSDRTRKQIAGVAPTTSLADAAFSGAYAPDMTAKVYAEVFRRAEMVLDSHRPVVIDATFRSAASRASAHQIALDRCIDFTFVECRVDRAVALSRLEARAHQREVSDGNAEIYDAFVESWEPVREFSCDEHVVVNTALSVDENIDFIGRRVIPLTRPEQKPAPSVTTCEGE